MRGREAAEQRPVYIPPLPTPARKQPHGHQGDMKKASGEPVFQVSGGFRASSAGRDLMMEAPGESIRDFAGAFAAARPDEMS
jgi:hypothetical protein